MYFTIEQNYTEILAIHSNAVTGLYLIPYHPTTKYPNAQELNGLYDVTAPSYTNRMAFADQIHANVTPLCGWHGTYVWVCSVVYVIRRCGCVSLYLLRMSWIYANETHVFVYYTAGTHIQTNEIFSKHCASISSTSPYTFPMWCFVYSEIHWTWACATIVSHVLHIYTLHHPYNTAILSWMLSSYVHAHNTNICSHECSIAIAEDVNIPCDSRKVQMVIYIYQSTSVYFVEKRINRNKFHTFLWCYWLWNNVWWLH